MQLIALPRLWGSLGKLLPAILLAILIPSTIQADDASDIARILELEDSLDEAQELRRAGEITRDEMKARRKAIKEEQKAIISARGNRRNPDRVAFEKKVRTVKKERQQALREARRAEREATKKAEAEARAARRETAVEEAAAAKQAAYEQAVAEASDFAQVHLPDEIAMPPNLETTEVQGVEFGMSREEVEEVLGERGYVSGRVQDEQSYRHVQVHFMGYELADMQGNGVRFLRYTQRFKPEIVFDAESILEELEDKYGPPTRATTGPDGGTLYYNIERPDYNLDVACQEEMARRDTLPERPYPPLAGPTSGKVWYERGERDIRERCPDQLPIFRHDMHAGMGFSAQMTVDSRTKEITIQWQDNGWEVRQRRRRYEDKFLKEDSGGEAEVKL